MKGVSRCRKAQKSTNSRTNDNTLFAFKHDIIRPSLIYSMDFDLKKTLEALLLSTAEPITLKDLVRIFARHHLELSQVLDDAKDEKDEEAEPMNCLLYTSRAHETLR